MAGAEFQIPVHFYDKIPMGLQYESVDLEHIITICRERQKALHLVESVALQQFDDEQQKFVKTQKKINLS